MATYKVIQDIEAEDKLVGPLSLKQFIFALIAIFLGFLMFKLAIAEVLGFTRWIFISLLVLPTLLFAVLAAPLGGEQSTELWLLARIRFLLKPRRRIWDQTGPKQLVTITVPKKLERHLTKGFSQDEARSRLGALANVMDSRGWAVKNVSVNLSNPISDSLYNDESDDRLAPAIAVPQQVEMADFSASDDILDENNNSTAQHLSEMIKESEKEHRDILQQQIDQARSMRDSKVPDENDTAEAANLWFDKQTTNNDMPPQPYVNNKVREPVNTMSLEPDYAETAAPTSAIEQLTELPPVNYVSGGSGPAVAPGTASTSASATVDDEAAADSLDTEEALLKKAHQKQEEKIRANSFGHLKKLKPLGENEVATLNKEEQYPQTNNSDLNLSPDITLKQLDTKKTKAVSPKRPDPVIINLSKDNDKTVATLARQANHKDGKNGHDGEVVFRIEH